MDNNEYTIYCSRCGAPMKSNARYCMKCGNLNSEHEANTNMTKYIKNEVNTYQVGGGQIIKEEKGGTALANNTGSPLICFLVNSIIYILGLIIIFMVVSVDGFNMQAIILSQIPLLLSFFSYSMILIYSQELMFMKANKRWWSSLVPIYNNMVLGEVAFNSAIMGLLVFVPVIGWIFSLYLFYSLGKKFGKSGLLTMIFPFIMIPIIGFGSSLYDGEVYIRKGENTLEKEYIMKKVFIVVSGLVMILGIVLFIVSNTPLIQKTQNSVNNHYYVDVSKRVINKIEKAANNDGIECGNTDIYANSVNYLYYPDISKVVFIPFNYSKEAVQVFVKVVNNNGNLEYYISMTDGEFGFPLTKSDEVNVDIVTNYESIGVDSSIATCRIK